MSDWLGSERFRCSDWLPMVGSDKVAMHASERCESKDIPEALPRVPGNAGK